MYNPLLILAVITALLCQSSPALALAFGTNKAKATTVAKIQIASIPSDLSAIQDCRRSAYAGKPVALPAAKSFCNADQVQKPEYTCIIAKSKDGTVLGTADLNTRTKVVNNVLVREEARKQGIARLMMEAVENEMESGSTLKLTVMSKNAPAVGLYKSMGFVAPGVYGGLDALSSVSPLNFLMEMEKKMN